MCASAKGMQNASSVVQYAELPKGGAMKGCSAAVSMSGVFAGAVLLLVGCPANVNGDSNKGRAKTDIKSLETAVAAYQSRHGRLPENLTKLAEIQPDGGPAYIEESLLIDPWARPYHYDPNRRHPESGKPQIWTAGPDPANPEYKIANWPQTTPAFSLWDTLCTSAWARIALAMVLLGAAGVTCVAHVRYLSSRNGKPIGLRGNLTEFSIVVMLCGAVMLLLGTLLMPRYLE